MAFDILQQHKCYDFVRATYRCLWGVARNHFIFRTFLNQVLPSYDCRRYIRFCNWICNWTTGQGNTFWGIISWMNTIYIFYFYDASLLFSSQFFTFILGYVSFDSQHIRYGEGCRTNCLGYSMVG